MVILGGGAAATAAEIIGVPLVELLVGEDYRRTGDFLGIAVACLVPYTLAMAAHQVIMAHERSIQGILWGTAAGAVACVLLMLLAWRPAVLWVPFLALAGGLVAWCATVGTVLHRVVPFNVVKVVLKPLAVAVPVWAVAVLAKPMGMLGSLVLSMLTLVVGFLLLEPISLRGALRLVRGIRG